MTKAKLIKRTENRLDTAATLSVSRPHSASAAQAVVQTWVRQRQAAQLPNPRSAFAALFIQPGTTN